MSRNKKVIILLLIVLSIVGIILIFINKDSNLGKNSNFKEYVSKSEISDSTTGYTLDLRIYGTYNNKKINNIIRTSNYKNTDKDITVTKLNNDKDEVYNYLVKDGKYYEVKDNKTNVVDSIKYDDTEIYLRTINFITNQKQVEDKSIGEETYKVFEGTLKNDKLMDIIKLSDLEIKTESDSTTEVWVTKDNQIYKVYYRFDKMTIYASYFGYNNARVVDLDMFNDIQKTTKN